MQQYRPEEKKKDDSKSAAKKIREKEKGENEGTAATEMTGKEKEENVGTVGKEIRRKEKEEKESAAKEMRGKEKEENEGTAGKEKEEKESAANKKRGKEKEEKESAGKEIKRREKEENKKRNDDVEIVRVTHNAGKPEKRKKRRMDPSEINTIKSGGMLTDVSVNVAQNILHEQNPLCEGLEETTLGKFLQFSICGREFAQIIFTGQCHWLSVTNIGCKKGEVNIFDSLSHGTVNSNTMKQVASILHEEGPNIVLNIKSVQQQQNGTDCGVFSIAFLTSLLNGEDPSTTAYHNDQLRTHLLTCIANGCLSSFPQIPFSTVKRCKETKIVTKLFCDCHMPWDRNDSKKRATQMASCDTCDE